MISFMARLECLLIWRSRPLSCSLPFFVFSCSLLVVRVVEVILEIAIVTVVAVAVWIVTPWTQCASMVTTTAIACAVQMNDLNLWSIKIMCRQRREMRRNWWLIIRFKRKWPEDLPITLNSSSSFELMSKDSTSHMVISGEQEIIILT